ncbi:MAG: glycosyltransferase family 4 protein [Terriglobia bacterium]
MKIFVVEPYLRNPGHYERLALRTCEVFARLGNAVTLVTYNGMNGDGARDFLPFTVANAISVKSRKPSARTAQPIYPRGLRTLLRWHIREYRTSLLLRSLLPGAEPSITHFYDADPVALTFVINFMLRPRRKRARPAIVLTIHQMGESLNPSRRMTTRIYRSIYRRCYRRLVTRDLDGVVVLDPSLKSGLLNYFNLDRERAALIRVLPHGIGDPVDEVSKNEARQRLHLPAGDVIFLVFGVLRKDKRVDLAIEAVKDMPGGRLVIAGGAQDFTESAIADLIHRQGCEKWVTADIDYIPEQRMHDYFSACDAVIIPYDHLFKGLSGILTLACGHGRPVIASDVSLLGETVKRRQIGFTVEPDSAPALREAMLRFLSLTADERAQMERRVQFYASEMSWDSACEKWLEFYRELLDLRSKPRPS